MSLVQKNIKSSIWNIIDVALYPVVFLATTPYFISRLGEEVFGLWMLLNSLLIAFQVFNFGLSTSTVKYVAQFNHLNQAQRLKIVINTNLSISILLFLLSILLGLLIGWAVVSQDLFSLPVHLKQMAAKAIRITCIIVGLKFIEQIFLNAFKGLNLFDRYAIINGTIRFGTLGINILQLNFSASLLTMLLTNLCITIIMLIVQFFLLRNAVIGFSPRFLLRKKFIKEVGEFGMLTWLQSMIVIVVFQLDKYLVITYYGPDTLGNYAISSTIFVNIHTVFTACVTWLIPKMVQYKSRKQESQRLFESMRAFITMLGIGTLSIFVIIHKPLFDLWIGAEKFESIREYIRLFTIFEFFYLLVIVPPLYLNYSGYVKQGTTVIYIISILNIAGIIVGYLMTNTISGILYGLIFSTIAGSIIIYIMMNNLLKSKNIFWEVLLFIGLSAFASVLTFIDNPGLQLLIFVAILYIFYLSFIKKQRFLLSNLFE